MQGPVAHSDVAVQVCPLRFLQLPDPSHVLVPAQVLGVTLSVIPLPIGPQVPGITPSAQDWQAGQLATPQQTPSVQKPETHSVAPPHA
jgi:hypothetical protein